MNRGGDFIVEIFNVTSLTTGDFIKDITPDWLVTPLKSTVRGSDENSSHIEYPNTSQYFSFTIFKKEFNSKVKKYESSKSAYKEKSKKKNK